MKVLSASSALDTRAQFTGEVATISKLLSPLSARDIGTIRCVGLNFKDHAAELGVSLPQVPTIFTKPCTALTGALDPIALPRSAPKAVDSEVELAVVIAEDCKDVTPTEAMEYVLGYTIANDLTARDLQSQTSQWGYCKGFDGFCPLGPVLASRQAVGDVGGLAMRTELDGQILQDSTPDQMIFSVGEMISHLSRVSPVPKSTDHARENGLSLMRQQGHHTSQGHSDPDRDAIRHWPQLLTTAVSEGWIASEGVHHPEARYLGQSRCCVASAAYEPSVDLGSMSRTISQTIEQQTPPHGHNRNDVIFLVLLFFT